MGDSVRRALGFIISALAVLGASELQAAEPQLRAIFPMGVSRLGPAEVTLDGSDLKDARELIFSLPGITAERVGDARFAVRVAGDEPSQDAVGDVWASTPGALSNPVRIAIGGLPALVEREKNDGDRAAQEVDLPVVIDAAINPATDRDDFRFSAAAGQRVSIVFRSASLGGSVRPALTVFAPDGRELLHDDGGHAEPALELRAAVGGKYRVRVEDRSYHRDASSTYRLALVTGPRLVAAFPTVLTRGKSQQLMLYGYELPGGQPAGVGFDPGMDCLSTTIDAPTTGGPDGGGWTLTSAALLDGFAYRHPGTYGAVRLGLVDEEVIRESDERHDSRKLAQEVALGSVIAGRFLRPGEVDWYRFAARKGETLWIEAVGERAALAMDLDLAIQDARGTTLLTLADSAQPKGAPAECPLDTLDPMGDWKVPADGEYALLIRDLYGPIAAGVERGYRLAIGPRREEARVVAMPPNGIAVKPGGSVRLPLIAVRRGGQKAAVTVSGEDLPPGLSIEPATIPAKQLAATLTLRAARDAPAWAGLLSLRAETELEGEVRPIPVLSAMLVRPGKPPVCRLTAGLAAAVTGSKAP